MNIDEINRKVFSELGKEKQLVEYRDIIHKLLGLLIDFINADGEFLKLSKINRFNPFCRMFHANRAGFTACRSCDQDNARRAATQREPRVYRCHAGLTEIVVPLHDHADNYIGGMTSGQFRAENDDALPNEFFHAIAQKYGLDGDRLCRLYNETLILSPQQIEGVIEYLQTIGRFIVNTHNQLLFMETIDAPDKIALIKQFVEENYMRKLTVPEVAKKFFLSAGHFSRVFKQSVGVSFISFLNMYRVAKAEEMLRQTSRNISEIAFLSGFDSISQFNRAFKNVKKRPPSACRKLRKEWKNSGHR